MAAIGATAGIAMLQKASATNLTNQILHATPQKGSWEQCSLFHTVARRALTLRSEFEPYKMYITDRCLRGARLDFVCYNYASSTQEERHAECLCY